MSVKSFIKKQEKFIRVFTYAFLLLIFTMNFGIIPRIENIMVATVISFIFLVLSLYYLGSLTMEGLFSLKKTFEYLSNLKLWTVIALLVSIFLVFDWGSKLPEFIYKIQPLSLTLQQLIVEEIRAFGLLIISFHLMLSAQIFFFKSNKSAD